MLVFKSETKEVHQAITSLSRDLHTATSKFLKKDALTPTRFEILEVLMFHDSAGVTQAELARLLSMQPANVLMAVRPLFERGWVVRNDKEFNLKEKNLSLTEKCLQEFPPIRERYYKAMEKVYSDNAPEGLLEWIRRLRIRVNS